MGCRIIFPEMGRVAVVEYSAPRPSAGEVRVRTLKSLVSIGTETTILHHRYGSGTHFARMFNFPQYQTGVQTVAEVLDTAPDVSDFAPGDRLFMRYGHTSEWTLPAAKCSPVPSGLEPADACWCGLAKTAFRAAWAAPFALGGRVLIIGAGPVGQMTLRWALAAGMREIIVTDLFAARLRHAQAAGAVTTVEGDLTDTPVGALTGDGFELVVDTTGNPKVFAGALGTLAPFGRLVLLGDTGFPQQQHLTSDMMTKGLTVVATHDHHDRDGWTQRRIDQLFFELVRRDAFRLNGLITHTFAPEAAEEAYRLASERREEAMGILFDWAGVSPLSERAKAS
jgi:2-desacetyl-2-hydroxyethyl bacteriochlorophyllide A dehydrogenase